MSEGRGVYRVLVGKPERKRPLGKPRRRWVDNIRTDLQEVGCGYKDWIGLAQNRDRWRTLVSAVMNLRVPWNAGNFLTSFKPVSFSIRTLHHGVSKYHPDIQYFLGQRCDDPGLFFEAKRGPPAKKYGKHWLGWRIRVMIILLCRIQRTS